MLMRTDAATIARAGAEPSRLGRDGSARRVLIDGLNLDLEQGTGIKTYSLGLEAALRANGHHPSWLFGREVDTGGDPLASGAGFSGAARRPTTTLGRRLRMLRLYRIALLASRRRAQTIDLRHIIRSPGATAPAQVLNVAALHETAMLRHAWTRRFTRILPPEPVDIFHLTYPHPLQMDATPTVVTIHDLIPLRLPYLTLDIPAEVVARHRRAVQQAALIVTVSECSRRDICSLLDVDPARVEVTYQSSSLPRLTRREQLDLPHTLASLDLQRGGYLLFVGAVEPKKNLRRLIEAAKAADIDIPLVIAGPRAWLADQELAGLAQTPGERVRYLGYQPFDTLRALYAGARAFVFPSIYEGFGLPVLEALGFGLPVLAAGNAALPEVAGTAAAYVDPFDVRGLREGLERLAKDDELCGRLRLAAPRQAALFSAARYQQRLADAYDRVSGPAALRD